MTWIPTDWHSARFIAVLVAMVFAMSATAGADAAAAGEPKIDFQEQIIDGTVTNGTLNESTLERDNASALPVGGDAERAIGTALPHRNAEAIEEWFERHAVVPLLKLAARVGANGFGFGYWLVGAVGVGVAQLTIHASVVGSIGLYFWILLTDMRRHAR